MRFPLLYLDIFPGNIILLLSSTLSVSLTHTPSTHMHIPNTHTHRHQVSLIFLVTILFLSHSAVHHLVHTELFCLYSAFWIIAQISTCILSPSWSFLNISLWLLHPGSINTSSPGTVPTLLPHWAGKPLKYSLALVSSRLPKAQHHSGPERGLANCLMGQWRARISAFFSLTQLGNREYPIFPLSRAS